MRHFLKPVAAALALTIFSSGCYMRMSPQTADDLATLGVLAFVGTALVLASHDAHYHDEYCGHERRYHEGRWLYFYSGRWEYHEHGHWYHYRAERRHHGGHRPARVQYHQAR